MTNEQMATAISRLIAAVNATYASNESEGLPSELWNANVAAAKAYLEWRALEPKAPDFRALLEEAWKAADGNEGDHVLGSDLNERIKSALNLLAEPKGCQLQNARVCAEWPACVCGRTLGSVVNRTAEGK